MRHSGPWSAIVLSLLLTTWVSGCYKGMSIATIQSVCGNGRCGEGETPSSCSPDCPVHTCGNHLCEFDESEGSCPEDCDSIRCGDHVCAGPENPRTCPEDCPWGICGNNVCEGEDVQNECSLDCWPSHCGDSICDAAETVRDCPLDCPSTQAVDILVVVDDSESMLAYQARFAQALPVMYEELLRSLGTTLDLHVGVVTTDLGAGDYTMVGGCQDVGGDEGEIGMAGGRRIADDCLSPGVGYLVDVAPSGCNYVRYADGQCGESDCTDDNCWDSGTGLVIDADTGCPRCRNFQADAQSTFGCLVSVGTNGCGFEQPLQAMRLGLRDNPRNAGFLRPDSLVLIVFLSDEDDCTASDPERLFNPDPAVEYALGPLTSYRCTRYGVTCDQSLDEPGTKSHCEPVQTDWLVAAPEEYVDFLLGIRDPGRVVVATITGPFDGTMDVQRDEQGRLQLQPSCMSRVEPITAVPAVRLAWFSGQFYVPGFDALDQSICNDDYSEFAQRIASVVAKRLGEY